MTALGVVAAFCLTACEPNAPAPSPAETVSAAAVETSDAVASAPAALSANDLRRVCRAALADIHGQTLEAIQIDGLEGEIVNASWRAPVDGGRRQAQCRVEGDLVTWRLVGAPGAGDRWMNQSGDPVTRFTLDGDTVAITTTLPDGTTATETYAAVGGDSDRLAP